MMVPSSSKSLVILQHTTKSSLAGDMFFAAKWLISNRPSASQWLVVHALMRPRFIVKNLILADDIIEIRWSKNNKPIQALVAQRANSPFDESVLIG